MKNRLLLLCLLPLFAVAQADSVKSGVYQWQSPTSNTPVVLFEGAMRDLSWMQVSSNNIEAGIGRLTPPIAATEQLLIIRSGEVTIKVYDSSFLLTAGSIALIVPGESFSLTNNSNNNCSYYLFSYRGKDSKQVTGRSFVKKWEAIKFSPHDKGGIRNFMDQSTAICKRLEMHVTTLNAGINSHEPHTHRAPEMVLMIEGLTEMQIGQSFYKGNAGDIYFLGSNVLHAIRNEGPKPCMYYAIQFE